MKVRFTEEAYRRIMFYVENSNIEISGLGRVKRLEDGTMLVHKVYLLEQENSATSTDLDENDVSKLMFETREDEGFLNFWWHSHVDMGTFWSGTDMDTIKQFGKNGWLLSTVFNKKGDTRTAFYQGGDESRFFQHIWIDDIKHTVSSYEISKEEREALLAEMQKKCKKAYPSYGNYSGYGYDKYDDYDDLSNWEKVDGVWKWTGKGKRTYKGNDAAQGMGEKTEVQGTLPIGGQIVKVGFEGENTRMCSQELHEEYVEIFREGNDIAWKDLGLFEQMCMYDVFHAYYGREGNDHEVPAFYNTIMKEPSSAEKVTFYSTVLEHLEIMKREDGYGADDFEWTDDDIKVLGEVPVAYPKTAPGRIQYWKSLGLTIEQAVILEKNYDKVTNKTLKEMQDSFLAFNEEHKLKA